MRLLLDTNVILDALLERGEFAASAKLLLLQGRQGHVEMISASAATDIFYTVERALRPTINDRKLSSKKAQEMLSYILDIVSVIAVDEDIIKAAISLGWKDYEDAVQYCVAVANDVDYIVTRNKSDFEEDMVPAATPTEVLVILNKAEDSEKTHEEE